MNHRSAYAELRMFLGIGRNTTSHREKLLATAGALIGIAVVFWITAQANLGVITDQANILIVSSMGASAVLLFAVPHGALSQPWPVLGGQLISAIIGVSCQKFLPYGYLAAGAAVGLSVGAMYYLRCIHPPGGATALSAVIGGSSVDALGYGYVLFPVMLNVLALLVVAFLFNLWFPWRRYPVHIAQQHVPASTPPPSDREVELTQEDFAAAMQELDSYFDITTEGLTSLLELAKKHAEKNIDHPNTIIAGHYYSNGKLGSLWSIRQVVDAPTENTVNSKPGAAPVDPGKDKIIYKVIAGDGDYATGICLREEFRQWARFEVYQDNGRWVKLVDE